jgi:protein-S-isoprenylcysteine O-methyltransferase Ste14
MLLLVHDSVARWLVVAAAVAMALGEVVASYLGQTRDAGRLLGNPAELLRHSRLRDGAVVQDRWTKWILVVGVDLGLLGALLIARFMPALRAFANNWWTLGLGIAMILAGAALRAWSIVSLGRYFRREVTIEPGQRIVRRGPYRVLRHPSYTGLVLGLVGLGLAFGSWFGAAIVLLTVLVGLLPRIRVEERVLARAFGAEYTSYAASTWRLLPYVW